MSSTDALVDDMVGVGRWGSPGTPDRHRGSVGSITHTSTECLEASKRARVAGWPLGRIWTYWS
jgi:hypothetical protein